MRVIVTVPHYCDSRHRKASHYGSLSQPREVRAAALRACVASWHESFGQRQRLARLVRPPPLVANERTSVELTVVVCTVRDHHVLSDLGDTRQLLENVSVDVPPPFLGFACHALLRDALGRFDYYCYCEDDLVIRDPWLFVKLRWFQGLSSAGSLLQPNRFEATECGSAWKAYIDGELPRSATDRYQDPSEVPEVIGEYLGEVVRFCRTLNPHAGCFFLSAEQMESWSRKPYFLERESSFFSPLEGAATVGVMRTFRIYKPACDVANFLEIQHWGDAWLRKIARRDAGVRVPSPTRDNGVLERT